MKRGAVFHLSPDFPHQGVQQLAAVRGIGAVERRFQRLGGKAVPGEGPEGARGLVGEHAGAAAHRAGRNGGAAAVLDLHQVSAPENQIAVARERRELDRALRDVRDERAGREVAVFFLRRP